MAQYQTADGRWIVGNVQGESDYHGFLGWRDCVIQLTASGATPDSVNYLNAFRDYAFTHKALNESIMPPSVNVWISNNGTTTAVQADDLSVDGNTFTIGGIKWTGSAWDYSNAGQGGGGGSGGGVLLVNDDVQTGTLDKTWQEIHDAAPLVWIEDEGGYVSLSAVFEDEGDYCVVFIEPQPNGNKINTYIATSADGYPVLQTG
jgi:hypothetical protein